MKNIAISYINQYIPKFIKQHMPLSQYYAAKDWTSSRHMQAPYRRSEEHRRVLHFHSSPITQIGYSIRRAYSNKQRHTLSKYSPIAQ